MSPPGNYRRLEREYFRLKPDSAVALNRKRQAQPFGSKVDGFLPLSKHRAQVLRRNVKACNNKVRKRKSDFEILRLDAFATPGFHLACRLLSLTAESGLNR
jgi:hypothetical protein